MTPEGCCRLLEFQVCWQLISRTWCSNSFIRKMNMKSFNFHTL